MPNADENSDHFRFTAKWDNCMDECKCCRWHSANNVYIIASTKWGESTKATELIWAYASFHTIENIRPILLYFDMRPVFTSSSSPPPSPSLCLLFILLHSVYSTRLDHSHQHQLTWALSAQCIICGSYFNNDIRNSTKCIIL